MHDLLLKLPFIRERPLKIHINRNGFMESFHEVDIAVSNADGDIIFGMGDVNSIIFPRSAMKPLQAIATIELLCERSDVPELLESEVAVMCSSHNGEVFHTEAIAHLLSKFDVTIEELICGAHWSLHQETLLSQARCMDMPHKVHNNCSGKHAGMLILSKLLSGKTIGYEELSGVTQQKILRVLEFMTGVDLMRYPYGVDGCGAPVFAAPLINWARAFAVFCGGNERTKERIFACKKIQNCIAAEPLYVAGHGRACSAINAAYGKAITVKTGAEGVYSAAFNELALGAMIKVRDGNRRGAEVAIGAVIEAFGYPRKQSLKDFFRPKLKNWAGDVVGDIKFEGLDI